MFGGLKSVTKIFYKYPKFTFMQKNISSAPRALTLFISLTVITCWHEHSSPSLCPRGLTCSSCVTISMYHMHSCRVGAWLTGNQSSVCGTLCSTQQEAEGNGLVWWRHILMVEHNLGGRLFFVCLSSLRALAVYEALSGNRWSRSWVSVFSSPSVACEMAEWGVVFAAHQCQIRPFITRH